MYQSNSLYCINYISLLKLVTAALMGLLCKIFYVTSNLFNAETERVSDEDTSMKVLEYRWSSAHLT